MLTNLENPNEWKTYDYLDDNRSGLFDDTWNSRSEGIAPNTISSTLVTTQVEPTRKRKKPAQFDAGTNEEERSSKRQKVTRDALKTMTSLDEALPSRGSTGRDSND